MTKGCDKKRLAVNKYKTVKMFTESSRPETAVTIRLFPPFAIIKNLPDKT